ncbi:MAG: hypothetical protein MMC33_009325 [Icmadophila ericetorum]|nr:hypothetical protein [Icmadophila ericetorum]
MTASDLDDWQKNPPVPKPIASAPPAATYPTATYPTATYPTATYPTASYSTATSSYPTAIYPVVTYPSGPFYYPIPVQQAHLPHPHSTYSQVAPCAPQTPPPEQIIIPVPDPREWPRIPVTENHAEHHDTGARLQALALVEFGIPPHHVSHWTGISVGSIYRLKKKARQRGYDPKVSRLLKAEYVVDGKRTGRRKKVRPEADREGGGTEERSNRMEKGDGNRDKSDSKLEDNE